MSMVVSTFLALAVTVIIYAWLGQGGAVSGLIFFGILLLGGIYRVFGPKPQSKQLPQ
jgi:hypothetical protein